MLFHEENKIDINLTSQLNSLKREVKDIQKVVTQVMFLSWKLGENTNSRQVKQNLKDKLSSFQTSSFYGIIDMAIIKYIGIDRLLNYLAWV